MATGSSFTPPDGAYVISVQPEDPRSADALRLVDNLWRYLDECYGPNPRSRFTPEQIDVPGAVFFVARIGREAAGCGALLPFASDAGEIKRMWVEPAQRRRGVALAVLGSIEQYAKLRGWPRLRLETGIRQTEAAAFYRAAGFQPIPCWGAYAADPISLCFEKVFRADLRE